MTACLNVRHRTFRSFCKFEPTNLTIGMSPTLLNLAYHCNVSTVAIDEHQSIDLRLQGICCCRDVPSTGQSRKYISETDRLNTNSITTSVP